MPVGAEEQIQALQLELPPAAKPQGVYKPTVFAGGLLYISGHGPLLPDGTLIKGKVGAEPDWQVGYQAARQTGLAILATLRQSLGSLDRIARVVKLFGMVNATADFVDHPKVINGCSDLFASVFGTDQGVGARSAVGMISLPAGMMVEIEGIFELHPEA